MGCHAGTAVARTAPPAASSSAAILATLLSAWTQTLPRSSVPSTIFGWSVGRVVLASGSPVESTISPATEVEVSPKSPETATIASWWSRAYACDTRSGVTIALGHTTRSACRARALAHSSGKLTSKHVSTLT